ncbi:MAG TPA: metallopeptidase TldD-related protein [Bryobacteraceae bacterium]|nr:metallopeptidase TldD-related protein [Bryobacteraceae bacterium]
MKSWIVIALCAAGVAAGAVSSGDWRSDTQLRAMSDELARSRTLRLNSLDKPYFIQYTTEDTDELSVNASLGGITGSSKTHVRRPNAVVRVGDYAFDNTNTGAPLRLRFGLFPLDDDYLAMRTLLWRTTDVLYKAANDQITRKRNAMREIADPDKTPDLASAKAVEMLEPEPKFAVDESRWDDITRQASERFSAYPEITNSRVRVEMLASTFRLVNSEGTVIRVPEVLNEVEIRAGGRTKDGQRVWNHQFVTGADTQRMPPAVELNKIADSVAHETQALTQAPLAEDYTGPVLFTGEAAAEMMAQVLTDAVVLHRKPMAAPGSNEANQQSLESVWSARLGSTVAPEWLSIYDDPTAKDFHGARLAGHYLVDDEGVRAERVNLVEKGKLRGFLLSRTPVRKFAVSNGHGRIGTGYGATEAVIGNVMVEASQTVPEQQLKKKLIAQVNTAGLKYGLIVRRLDFPSTASLGELQSMERQLQRNGYARTLAQPLLAYRVYPDGREELVRGLRFSEFSAKDLRDVEAASDRPYVYNYINTGSSLNIADLRSEIVPSSVVCPSLLLESVELARADNEGDPAPLVPPPALSKN